MARTFNLITVGRLSFCNPTGGTADVEDDGPPGGGVGGADASGGGGGADDTPGGGGGGAADKPGGRGGVGGADASSGGGGADDTPGGGGSGDDASSSASPGNILNRSRSSSKDISFNDDASGDEGSDEPGGGGGGGDDASGGGGGAEDMPGRGGAGAGKPVSCLFLLPLDVLLFFLPLPFFPLLEPLALKLFPNSFKLFVFFAWCSISSCSCSNNCCFSSDDSALYSASF